MKINLNPKQLFLIDGIGALLSAFLLGIVLVRFEHMFRIPTSVLYVLAVIPLFFAVYDFYFYRKGHQKLGLALKGIALLNLIYCSISIGVLWYHFDQVKLLGWIYIIVEIVIVLFLAMVEFKTGNEMLKTSKA